MTDVELLLIAINYFMDDPASSSLIFFFSFVGLIPQFKTLLDIVGDEGSFS